MLVWWTFTAVTADALPQPQRHGGPGKRLQAHTVGTFTVALGAAASCKFGASLNQEMVRNPVDGVP